VTASLENGRLALRLRGFGVFCFRVFRIRLVAQLRGERAGFLKANYAAFTIAMKPCALTVTG